MIHFIVATQPEAQPIIDIFKLRKIQNSNILPIYNSKNISLTITGIGKVNSAIGVTQTHYEITQQKNDIWINIGLAGHEKFDIGKIFVVNKISDYSSGKVFFPFISDLEIKSLECISFDKENKKYNNSMSDMESIGFYQAANKYSTKELINILKIVSDNKKESIDFFDKKKIYNMIIQHRDLIIENCKHLNEIKNNILKNNDGLIKETYEKLIDKEKFSFTETQQIKALLKLYFSKNKFMKKNILNKNKDGAYNITKLKEFLKL